MTKNAFILSFFLIEYIIRGDVKMNILKSIFDHEYKELKKFEEIANKIDAMDEKMQAMSDQELQQKTLEFKERLSNGETLDDILVEAFALAREAALELLGRNPFMYNF